MEEEISRPERVAHWQKACKAACPLCWIEAHREAKDRLSWFVDTGMTLQVGERIQPVMRNDRGRLFVGETLSRMNPGGLGGRVWTAMDLEQLKYNVSFRQPTQEYNA
jgi:hypothetical protein